MSCPIDEIKKEVQSLKDYINNNNSFDSRLSKWFTDIYLTTEQIAQLLDLNIETVRRKMKSGEIPFVMKGSDFRCLGKDFIDYTDKINRKNK